jgi:hypothetical protein
MEARVNEGAQSFPTVLEVFGETPVASRPLASAVLPYSASEPIVAGNGGKAQAGKARG